MSDMQFKEQTWATAITLTVNGFIFSNLKEIILAGKVLMSFAAVIVSLLALRLIWDRAKSFEEEQRLTLSCCKFIKGSAGFYAVLVVLSLLVVILRSLGCF